MGVALLHVQIEANIPAFDESPVDRLGCLPSMCESFHRVWDLRSVHADVADLLDAPAEPDVDGIAVYDPDDAAPKPRQRPPPFPRYASRKSAHRVRRAKSSSQSGRSYSLVDGYGSILFH